MPCNRTAGRLTGIAGFAGGVTVHGLDRDWPELGRVRIETENELALPSGDQISEAVAKGCCRRLDQPPLTVCLSFAPAENFGTLLALIWIFSPVCGFTP